jgi:D-alanine transaminase
MDALANVNGQTMPLTEVKISAMDRGFLFGDAVYEVLRVYQGMPWLMDEHMQRLARSLDAIRIKGVDLVRLGRRVSETIAAGPFTEAIVYMQITRGAAPRAHKFPTGITPLEVLYVQEFVDPFTSYRQNGAPVITQPDTRWDRCDIKSTNLLGNVLAMQNAVEAGCVEALFYWPDGTLTEGTHTSFFGVLDGNLLTSPNSNAILPGITRGLILRLAKRAGIPVQEHVLMRADLARVTELFLTGTTSEVLPIVRVDDQAIAGGRPGPVTRRLQQAYAEEVKEFTEDEPRPQ